MGKGHWPESSGHRRPLPPPPSPLPGQGYLPNQIMPGQACKYVPNIHTYVYVPM